MVFSVDSSKYNCDSGKGLTQREVPGILGMINKIAEWDMVQFPYNTEKKVMVDLGQDLGGEKETTIRLENREFLGPNPTLVPGSIISTLDILVGVNDPDTLVLMYPAEQSAVGRFKRMVDEVILPEYMYLTMDVSHVTGLTWNRIFEPDPEVYQERAEIAFPEYKIFVDRFLAGRVGAINVLWNHSDFGLLDFTMDKREVRFKSDSFSEEEDQDFMGCIAREVMAYLIQTTPRAICPADVVHKTEEWIKKEVQDLMIERALNAKMKKEESNL